MRRGRRRRRIEHKRAAEEEEDDEGFPRWFMGVTYAAIVLWCLMCGLYTLAVCLYFGPVASLEWLFCSFSATSSSASVRYGSCAMCRPEGRVEARSSRRRH